MKNLVFITQLSIFFAAGTLVPHFTYAQTTRPCCSDSSGPKSWYAGISGSAVLLDDVNITHSNPAYSNPDGQSYKTGQAISGTIGYKVLSGVRTELEITSRKNTVSKDNNATNPLPAGARSIQSSTAVMVNGYVDLHNNTHFTPYLGAGIGQAYIRNPRFYVDNGTGQTSSTLRGWATSYQFMTGINYEVRDYAFPLDIILGYRYFTADDVKTTSTLVNFPSQLNFTNTTHNIELGIRIYF